MSISSSGLVAQSPDDYHPFLSDRFNLGVGLFYPAKSFKIRVDGTVPGDEIDFEEGLRVGESQTTGSMNFRWRFGEKWSLWGQYWQVDSDAGASLDEDIEWGDLTFKEGTFANAGIDLSIARLFFGRKFDMAPQHELGIGAGLHWMELGAYMEGQIITEQSDTEFHRANASAEFPLPNIGGWYMYSWSPKWVLQARVDWLRASIGDYSGGLWNGQAGINWQAFKHVGLGLYYNVFYLDVDVDKESWNGTAEVTQHGPFLALTFTW
jgi:hypothetical protein